MSQKNPPTESPSDDIAWGVGGENGIAAAINRSPQQTYYLIAKGRLPVRKLGHRMLSASRAALRKAVIADNSEIT
jgi:hypothetical protein